MRKSNVVSVLIKAMCVLFLVGVNVAAGDTYYVSLSGDNNWTGQTPETAFRTITKGATVITAGDTLIIASGNYGSEYISVTHTGTASEPILIKAETAGEVLLDGGTGSGRGMSIVDVSYITVEGLKFTNYSQAIYCKRAAYITVRESIFIDNDTAGIITSLSSLTEMGSNHHYLFTENQFLDPAGGQRQDYGLCLYFADHVEVLNNYFYGEHNQACSFKELMSDSRVAGNTFDGFLYSAIYLGQNDDMPCGYPARSSNLIVENNVFRSAQGYGAKRAVCAANVDGAIIRNNFIDSINACHSSHTAIDIAPNSTGTEVYGNTIINVQCESAMELRTSDCEVYNNTIAGCDTGLAIVNGANPVLRNNIFFDNDTQVSILPAPTYNGSEEHSAYYNPDAAHLWIWTPDYGNDPLLEHNDWFPDYSGKGATDISANPQFIGPLTNLGVGGLNPVFVPDITRVEVYRLADGSPCIDEGMDVGLPYNGSAPDIGAFEYGCGSWGYLVADVNKDCYVDLTDFATLAESWLACTNPLDSNCMNML